MRCLTVEFQSVVEHAEYTVNNADIVSCVLKDRTLLDVGLEHIHVFFRGNAEFLISFEP